jgi:2'-5' RNA ligase
LPYATLKVPAARPENSPSAITKQRQNYGINIPVLLALSANHNPLGPMPRLFIAIDLPPVHRARIRSICTGIPGARWTPVAQIHLTLRFIGEVDFLLMQQISENLAEVRTEPLTLRIKGLGHFPPGRSPKVLWVGLENSARLLRLRKRLETALVQIGLEPERRKFAPHITLARFNTPPTKPLRDFLATNQLFELPPFPVQEFHLYSSRLTSSGAIHQLEASYPVITLEKEGN